MDKGDILCVLGGFMNLDRTTQDERIAKSLRSDETQQAWAKAYQSVRDPNQGFKELEAAVWEIYKKLNS